MQVLLADSRALRNDTNPVNHSYFRKRVVGVETGAVYYDSPVGAFANGSATCSEVQTPCSGANMSGACTL